jgi:hypothetical protein
MSCKFFGDETYSRRSRQILSYFNLHPTNLILQMEDVNIFEGVPILLTYLLQPVSGAYNQTLFRNFQRSTQAS